MSITLIKVTTTSASPSTTIATNDNINNKFVYMCVSQSS